MSNQVTSNQYISVVFEHDFYGDQIHSYYKNDEPDDYVCEEIEKYIESNIVYTGYRQNTEHGRKYNIWVLKPGQEKKQTFTLFLEDTYYNVEIDITNACYIFPNNIYVNNFKINNTLYVVDN